MGDYGLIIILLSFFPIKFAIKNEVVESANDEYT